MIMKQEEKIEEIMAGQKALERQNETLQVQCGTMQIQMEELRTQNEQLRVQNEALKSEIDLKMDGQCEEIERSVNER
jgi:regulator of replication initiation timing